MSYYLPLNKEDKDFIADVRNEILSAAKAHLQHRNDLDESDRNNILRRFTENLESKLDAVTMQLFSYHGPQETKASLKPSIRSNIVEMSSHIDQYCEDYLRMKKEMEERLEEQNMFASFGRDSDAEEKARDLYEKSKPEFEQRFKKIQAAVKELKQKSTAEEKKRDMDRYFERKRKENPDYIPSAEEIKHAEDLMYVDPLQHPQSALEHLKSSEAMTAKIAKDNKEHKPKHFWTWLMDYLSKKDDDAFGGGYQFPSISISFCIILVVILVLIIIVWYNYSYFSDQRYEKV
jgi:hypothetical protein